MPYMEITLPKTDRDVKARLVRRITDEFINATGFEDEVLHIKLSEYAPGETAIGGELREQQGKPYLNLVLFSPRLRFDVKRSLAAAITAAFTESLNQEGWKPAIHIIEFPYDNIALDGQLLTDIDDELASRPYYYVLPR